jgi:hypothetical protein
LVEDNNQDDEVSWQVAAHVWWAQTWRWSSVMVVTWGVVTPLLIILPFNNDRAIVIGVAANLFLLLSGIWATKCSLKAQYRAFSIAIKCKSQQSQ